MADKKNIYASVVLVDGMEYMVSVDKDWLDKGFEKEGFFQAKTMDGKPILFGEDRINLLREVSDEEFKAWKKNLDAYRAQKAKENDITINGKK